jgi:hypothetical protein
VISWPWHDIILFLSFLGCRKELQSLFVQILIWKKESMGDRVSQIWQPLLTSLPIEAIYEGISTCKSQAPSSNCWPEI